jgi:hypothetical protein
MTGNEVHLAGDETAHQAFARVRVDQRPQRREQQGMMGEDGVVATADSFAEHRVGQFERHQQAAHGALS